MKNKTCDACNKNCNNNPVLVLLCLSSNNIYYESITTIEKVETKKLSTIDELIQAELNRANEKFPAFSSSHEGIAVFYEELNETTDEIENINKNLLILWSQIRQNKRTIDAAVAIRKHTKLLIEESIQLAAMAQKFIDSLENKNQQIKMF